MSDCSPARDTVSYARRTNDIFADPDGVADDGEAGEGDMLADDFERIIGGRGNDVLVGTTSEGLVRGETRLFGSLLHGRGGNDILRGSRAGDTLDGNRGNDILRGAGDGDTLDGGPGRDALLGHRGRDLILEGAEAICLSGAGSRPTCRR